MTPTEIVAELRRIAALPSDKIMSAIFYLHDDVWKAMGVCMSTRENFVFAKTLRIRTFFLLVAEYVLSEESDRQTYLANKREELRDEYATGLDSPTGDAE